VLTGKDLESAAGFDDREECCDAWSGVLTVTCVVCHDLAPAHQLPYQLLQTPRSPDLPQRTPTGCEYPGSVPTLRRPRWFHLSPLLPSHLQTSAWMVDEEFQARQGCRETISR